MTHFEAGRGITVTRRDIRTGVRALHLSGRPLCVHASLRAFGWVEGGPSAVVESLLAEGCTVMVPTHSYAYHIAPPGGEPSPPRDAPVYTPASQVLDRQYMGAIPYTVLQMPERVRGDHPLDSFTAVGPLATELIASQTAQEVYAPLRVLAGRGGWVLLMGVGLDKLTLLHLAEALAGRPMFQHWALGPDRRPLQVRIGGCSDGFVNLEPALAPLSRACRVGASRWHAYPVRELLDAAADAIRADPWITHCGRPECEECNLAVSSTPKPRERRARRKRMNDLRSHTMPNQSASSSTWDRMCEFTAGLVEKHAVPGVAVGLFHAGDTHTAGFGVTNVDHPLPVTPATLFQVGSITKTFTATLIIRLVEMDMLDLDAPVRSYVPEFHVADKDTSARATVRHLLTHTGGWPGDVFLDTGGGDDALTRYVAAMADLEQLAPLGTIWSYNNAGFYLAGHIVELVTGKSYRDALAELVLEPLGLRNIFFDPAEVMTHRFAVGHDVADGKPEVARPWALPRAVHPVGGIICDVPALLRYARFQIEAGKTEQGRQLLSPGAMAQMHSTQVTIGGHHEAMGLSWFINHADGVKQISHGGGTKGQVSLLLIVPERRFAVAILTNADQGGFVTRDVSRWLLKQYLGLEITDPEPKDAPAERLAPYTGRYTRPYADVELGLLTGKLVGQVVYKQGFPSQDVPPAPPPPPMTLALYDDDRLIVTDGPFKDTRAQILRAPDGEIGWLRFGTRIHVRQRAEDTEPPA